MRERKYVKFRVDMHEDTKFKIIDMKPERDIIHYIWTRILLLAGKVNLEGELYLSRNIPYTIETLAIEFNRDIEQIKLALDVFLELEMIEIIENKIYRVKNFAKHQNIKVKEKCISEKKDCYAKSIEVQLNDNLTDNSEFAINKDTNKYLDNKISENQVENSVNINKFESEITNENIMNKEIDQYSDSINKENSSGNLQDDNPISFESKKSNKNKKNSNKMKKEIRLDIDDINEDNSICYFTDEVRPLGDGESTILEWSFG